jgi:hypothetical protein
MVDGSKTVLSIFLSHLSSDRQAVEKLEEVFESRAGGKLQFFVAEAISAGKEWLKEIKDQLLSADFLFLLYTDPHADWDWCLYETGLFDGVKLSTELDGDSKKRIIVFHSPVASRPPQLGYLQAVRADRAGLETFLRDFFGSTEITGLSEPLSADYVKWPDQVAHDAKCLSQLFSAKVGGKVKQIGPARYYGNHLMLQLQNAEQFAHPEIQNIPEEAKIEGDDDAFRIFGMDNKPPRESHWTWGDLLARCKEFEDGYWIEELTQILCKACKGLEFAPVESTFQNPHTGRIYRPVVFRRDALTDGSLVFHLLFVDQVASGSAKAREPYATLLSALNLSSRMHWEVCDKFSDNLGAWSTEQWAERAASLLEALSNVEKEAVVREKVEFSRETQEDRLFYVFSKFGATEVAKTILENLSEQEILKRSIKQKAESRDRSGLQEMLQSLRLKNLEVMAAVSDSLNHSISSLGSTDGKAQEVTDRDGVTTKVEM